MCLANFVKQEVEIRQYELFHSYYEFNVNNQYLIHSKINIGQIILEKSIKKTKTLTFITPYNHLFSTASQTIMPKGLNISASNSIVLAVEAPRWPTLFHSLYEYVVPFMIPAEHLINPRSDVLLGCILRIITAQNDKYNISALVNHSLDYFIDWDTPYPITFGF